MAENRPGGTRESVAAVALVGQLGLAVAGPILGGVIGGLYIYRAVGGGWGLVALFAGVFLGVSGAVVLAYWLIKPYLQN